jgi:hypothetical protein
MVKQGGQLNSCLNRETPKRGDRKGTSLASEQVGGSGTRCRQSQIKSNQAAPTGALTS